MVRIDKGLLAAVFISGIVALPAQTPEPPASGAGGVERLREEVKQKQLELKELRDAASLKAEAKQLSKDIAELSKSRLPEAELAELRSVTIPALKNELGKLREAKQLKLEASRLERQLAFERMSPDEQAEEERRKKSKVADLRDKLDGAMARMNQERAKLQQLQAEIAVQRAKKRTGKTAAVLRRHERAAKASERALKKERLRADSLFKELQAEELPAGDPFARATVTNREYQAALNLRPAWLPKLKYQDAQAVRAPDGHWWCVRSNDGYIEMRCFKEGVQGESTAHNWAGYYRRGGK